MTWIICDYFASIKQEFLDKNNTSYSVCSTNVRQKKIHISPGAHMSLTTVFKTLLPF